jgi:alanine racemase
MSDPRGAWLEIDLDAIRHNLALIRGLVGGAAVAPVVKADAYGHGMVEVARAVAPVADVLCVATLEEASRLRPLVGNRILLLYPVPHEAAAEAVALGVELPLMSAADLRAISEAAERQDASVRVHLGVETGMGRGGVAVAEAAAVAADVLAHPNVVLAGLWSHLHSPEDLAATAAQLGHLEAASAGLRAAGIPLPARHLAASGGIFASPVAALDLVRPGLAIHGVLDEDLPLAPRAAAAASELRPAMSLKARPVAFSDVPSGGTVGYGATWRAARPTRVAVLPVGYGDGYLRAAQPGAEVLVRGRRLPLVGRVSMDAVTVDVTDLPGLDYGEEFVLLGSQGTETISAGELARQRNTIAWEVLAGMARRLVRVYHPTAGTTDSE